MTGMASSASGRTPEISDLSAMNNRAAKSTAAATLQPLLTDALRHELKVLLLFDATAKTSTASKKSPGEKKEDWKE